MRPLTLEAGVGSLGADVLADRIHDDVLQLLGSAMLKAELCEQLGALGRATDVHSSLQELRDVLDRACFSLRDVMSDLRQTSRTFQTGQ